MMRWLSQHRCRWLLPADGLPQPTPEKERRQQQERLEEVERLAYLATWRDMYRRDLQQRQRQRQHDDG